MDMFRSTKIASSLPIIGVLLAIAGAYYISRSQLRSSRPKAPVGLKQPVTEKYKIEARLWQDPFKAVYDHRQTRRTADKKDPCEPTIYRLSEQIEHFIKKDSANATDTLTVFVENVKATVKSTIQSHFLDQRRLHIMLIMVRDGNSAEDYERRLRNRYAVLTALRAHGMSAKDTQHICYFTDVYRREHDLTGGGSRIDKIFPDKLEPIFFPYEWFECEELYPVTTKEWADDRPGKVLLIWLPESVFSEKPLTRLSQLIDALGRRRSRSGKISSYDWSRNMGKNEFIKVDLIGPSYSGTLREMLREIAKIQNGDYQPNHVNNVKSKLKHLGIFSPWSTASPALLVDEGFYVDQNTQDSALWMYEVIRDKFEKIGVEFFHMVGSDDLLAMHLIQELYRRGIDLFNEKDHVALISEWDTFYGKAFPLTFATMMESFNPEDPNLKLDWNEYADKLNRKMPGGERHTFPENLHNYTYICGIDGILTESNGSQDGQSGPSAQNGKSESLSSLVYTESLKRPIDRSQLDYVRRLAKKLGDEYRRFKKLKPSFKKLKAIGVVGTDVYDKLILLHALREQFSDVIFFTTDLDARLMHDEQYKWTRNLIVASNFGLELQGEYQRDIYQSQKESSFSTFRDNYQTSLFFACRVALGLRVASYEFEQKNLGTESTGLLSVSKRVFENLQAEMLREDSKAIMQSISHPRLFEIGRDRAVDISADDTDIHPLRPEPAWNRWTLIIMILFVTVLCSMLLVQVNASVRRIVRLISPAKWNYSGIVVKLGVIVAILFVVIAICDHYRYGGEPFLLTAGVSIWPGETLRLIALILSVLFLGKSYRDLTNHEVYLVKDFCLNTKWREGNYGSNVVIAQKLWQKYTNLGTCGKRAWRIIRISVIYILFVLTLMYILDSWPLNVPHRGKVSRIADFILFVSSTLSIIILIYFVVDATKLSLALVRSLKNPITLWPEDLVNKYRTQNITRPGTKAGFGTKSPSNSSCSISEKALAEWLDIKFIAAHTEVVGKLIYYPFIIILIMFVARSRYFDNWDFPISIIIVYLLNSTCALCCGLMLRREAEKTRSVALNRLRDELVRATGMGEEQYTKQVRAMIEEVESIRQGAYSPFTENPVLHAILIPSGGISLLTLLRFIPSF